MICEAQKLFTSCRAAREPGAAAAAGVTECPRPKGGGGLMQHVAHASAALRVRETHCPTLAHCCWSRALEWASRLRLCGMKWS